MRTHNVAVRPHPGDQDAGAMFSGGPGDDVDGVPQGVGQVGCVGGRHFKHAGVPGSAAHALRLLPGLSGDRAVGSRIHSIKVASRQ